MSTLAFMNEHAPENAVFDARRQLLVQAGLVLCCSAAFLVIGGTGSASAAFVGGTSALAGNLAFVGALKWRNPAAPTPGQALRVLVLAEAAKWVVSLSGLAMVLSGNSGIETATREPGAVVTGFCTAWVAPWLALWKRN